MTNQPQEHLYPITLQWTGNNGEGTSNYRIYDRSFKIIITEKPILLGSADAAFRGDKKKHNPEELLVASIASCQHSRVP